MDSGVLDDDSSAASRSRASLSGILASAVSSLSETFLSFNESPSTKVMHEVLPFALFKFSGGSRMLDPFVGDVGDSLCSL